MDKAIVVSVSGGKDSTATLLKALELHPKDNIYPIFADTHFEHPYTYEYLDYLEQQLDIKIIRVQSSKYQGVIDLIRTQKKFPNGRMRVCTQHLKQMPIREYLIANDLLNSEVWIGIRADESAQRNKKYGEITPTETFAINDIYPHYPKKYFKNSVVRYPIIDMGVEDVFSYITSKGIEANKLYSMGFDRVGCFPCVLSGMKIYKKAWQTPEGKANIQALIDLEEELEAASGTSSKIKFGKTRFWLIDKLNYVKPEQMELFKEVDDDEPKEEICSICQA